MRDPRALELLVCPGAERCAPCRGPCHKEERRPEGTPRAALRSSETLDRRHLPQAPEGADRHDKSREATLKLNHVAGLDGQASERERRQARSREEDAPAPQVLA